MFENGDVYVRGYTLRNGVSQKFIQVDPETTNVKYRKNPNIRFTRVIKGVRTFMILNMPNYGSSAFRSSNMNIHYRDTIQRMIQPYNPDNYGLKYAHGFQKLNYYAHTIQLLFKKMVERKKTQRAAIIEYLLCGQTEIRYLWNEYVLRDVFTYILGLRPKTSR
jgi:hypothetical protein